MEGCTIPLSLEFREVTLLLCDVPLSTFVSVSSTLRRLGKLALLN